MMYLCLALHQMVASGSEGKHSRDTHATNGFTGVSPSTLVEQKPPPSNARKLGAALEHPNLRWPGAVLKYDISALSDDKQKFLTDALKLMEEKFKEEGTCVRFEQSTNGYRVKVLNEPDSGCGSPIGYRKDAGYDPRGYQIMNLQGDVGQKKGSCWHKGIIWHEFFHALGFIHTHTRLDRDDHVEIIEENIKREKIKQFSKRFHGPFIAKNYGDYDFESLMHYEDKSFSRNNETTINTHDDTKQDVIGQRMYLSERDLASMKSHYEHICSKAEGPTPDLGCSNAHCENFIDVKGRGNCRPYEVEIPGFNFVATDYYCYMKESTKSKCAIVQSGENLKGAQGMVMSLQACKAGGWENEFCQRGDGLACSRGFECVPRDKDSEDYVCKKKNEKNADPVADTREAFP